MTKRLFETKLSKFNAEIPKYLQNLKIYSESAPSLDDMNYLIYGVFCKKYNKGNFICK